MNILLKQVLIADPNSPFNRQQVDIFIENNLIKQIGSLHDASAEIVINEPDLIVSPGWVDVFANFCEPGFEYKETLETGSSCAAAGGFTRVFALPNTKPVIDNKSLIEYVALKSEDLPIFIHPMGAISQKTEGNTLAEMYDMRNSGAVAFTDGIHPVQSSGLFLKALQYVKAFNGVLIQVPIDQSIGASGLMNEGIVSTQLGLPGIPAISEESMLKRDIDLVRYTNSKLHFTGISSSQSLQLIKDAKTEGLSVTCSVSPYHLFFCDEDLHDYNTYLKVNPPLRTRKDMLALREGIIDGTIDCIASHHFPQDWDHKVCEFEYAAFGMTGLQTAFSAVNHLMKDLSNDRLIDLFSNNARNIFGLPSSIIKEGNTAELTIFNKTATALFNNKSKSSNSAFAKITLQGLVKGIVNKGNIYL
jgi:dihydroorotase